MIAVNTKEFRMDHQLWNRRRLPMELCGPYVGDELDCREVRCVLQVGRAQVAVNVPADALREHRVQGGLGRIVLRVPGQQLVPVEVTPILTESQHRVSTGWCAEMEDFDRF